MRLPLAICALLPVLPLFGTLQAGCLEEGEVLSRPVPNGDGPFEPGPDGSVLPAPAIVWRFDEGSGARVFDSSGSGTLIHLRIEDADSVTWQPDALALTAPTRLVSERAPEAFVALVAETDAVTVEAWVVPAEAEVEGTRRILTLSESNTRRNLLLGQGGLFADGPVSIYGLRLRTEDTNANGLPMLRSEEGTASTGLTHLVAVHGPDASERLYVDGVLRAEGTRAGALDAWDPTYLFALGDEFGTTDDRRAWLGELHHVALYPRALSQSEVGALFAAGETR